jgi:hypothetical protein
LAVPVVVWRRIPMTTRFRAGLPTYMREIFRLKLFLHGLDQQESATFVLDGGHWIDAKIRSGHSGTEMELSLCGALAQRNPTATNGGLPAVQQPLF